LEGNVVTCQKHHAKFDVTSGELVSKPKIGFLHVNANDEPTYQVRVEDENIMVKL
jgi:nitrite reductase/ring-hydroxylating ferredoxin subunit